MNFVNLESLNILSKKNIGISILIPLYNGIEYLETSMQSVIDQTYSHWQLVIGINGHGADSDVYMQAQDISNKLNKNNCDILIKHYDTKGKSKTLNAMVADCKFDRIAILDVDDYWTPDKLEVQVPYLQDYDIVGARCEYFEGKTGSPPIPLGDITHSHNIFSYNPIINSSAIIKKEDAIWDDEAYIHPVEGLDDYSMWFKLYYLKRKFYNIDKILCFHRIHTNSAFNVSNDNRVDQLKQLWYNKFQNR